MTGEGHCCRFPQLQQAHCTYALPSHTIEHVNAIRQFKTLKRHKDKYSKGAFIISEYLVEQKVYRGLEKSRWPDFHGSVKNFEAKYNGVLKKSATT